MFSMKCFSGKASRCVQVRLFLAALAAVVFGPAAADASFLQFDLNSNFAGATPVKADNGKPYFLRIQLQDGTDGSGSYVLVTFISNLAVNDNQRFDFVTMNLTSISGTYSFTDPSGPAQLNSASVTSNGENLPGAGGSNRFDVTFNFDQSGQVPNNNALDGTDVFNVRFRNTANTLDQTSFSTTSSGSPALYAGAHVIGIQKVGNDDTSVSVFTTDPPDLVDLNPVPVPAPAGLVLGLIGGASLGGLGLRRGRRPQVVA